MARNSKYDHSTVVVVADDGSSPVGTNEWNAGHDESGMEGYTESTKTLATGKITPTDSVTIVAAESGTSDDFDLITYSETNANDKLYLFADSGDTITVRHNQTPGAGEAAIITTSASNITLSETVPLILMRRGTSYYQIVENTVGDASTSGTLAQFAATTSAQLAGVISDETGTGALVFANSPTLVTPALGTPASGVLTNCTGYTGDSSLVTTGTIASGTWQGTAIASAYLDADTAHLSGSQTFSGAKTFSSALTMSGANIDAGGNNVDNIQKTIFDITTVTSSTTIAIDFNLDDLRTLTLAHDTTFSSSNLSAGEQVEIHISSASAQTLAFPAGWTFYGDKPTTTTAGKDSVLYLTSLGTTDADVKAVFVEEA